MDVIQAKIERLRRGGKPRVMDVFAGCGGISLGFHTAGFEISAALEVDPLAARSHARNFHGHLSGDLFEKHARGRDIVATEPGALLRELGLGEVDTAIDVLVGGPPCQAFARVGRAKLREVAAHPEAFKLDDRAKLYVRYMDYIRALKPLAILMENVPDILNFGGHNIPAEMCETLEGEEFGYECGYALLNSAFYGVPQMRERCFLIAYRKELGVKPSFPDPTCYTVLPRGYGGSRQVALKHVGLLDPHYQEPAAARDSLPIAISAGTAIDDLPRITAHLEGKMKRGARRFTDMVPYRDDVKPTPYALEMRTWAGFESKGGIADHVIRSLPRDYRIFRRMNPGDEYPAAYRHAEALFEEHLAALRSKGLPVPHPDTTAWALERSKFVPPYDPGKFPNKWWKLRKDGPVRTIMAHIGKDSYSHIHYDDNQARTISVREAARLHSFPDGFIFEGTMNPAFRQIGNAVPPLMAKALATVLRQALSRGIAGTVSQAAAE
jgi:DNA (cytosine-5)-methyltransferase 1